MKDLEDLKEFIRSGELNKDEWNWEVMAVALFLLIEKVEGLEARVEELSKEAE